jgi:hypothetical protein
VPKVIFAVQRITRIGSKPLEYLLLTDDVFTREAGMGRGLLIGNCTKDRLIGHICHALCNALPLKSVVVTHSYELSEEIAEKLHSEHGVCVWQAVRHKRKGKGSSTESVQITIPEKLYIVSKHVCNEDYNPSFIHVVDPPGSLDRSSLSLSGNLRYRASNIARHKAVCEANGSIPYVLLWTTEICGSFIPSHMCSVMGLDAWYYANGQTLRTAGVRDLMGKDQI